MERVPSTPSRRPPSRNLGAAAVTLLSGVGAAMLAAPFIQALALALLAHRVVASPVVIAVAFVLAGLASLSAYAALTGEGRDGAGCTLACAMVPFVTAGLVLLVVAGI